MDESCKDGVFLSYKREDEEFVSKFYEALQLRGVKNVWMDVEKLRMGENWREKIYKAIESRAYLIVFVSKDALKSKIVKEEYEHALSLGKMVIPIIIEKDLAFGTAPVPHVLTELNGKMLRPSEEDFNTVITQIVSGADFCRTPVQYPTMIHVPSGNFPMGNRPRLYDTEVDEFWIAKFPVTVIEYELFVRDDGFSKYQYWPTDISENSNLLMKHGFGTWPSENLSKYAIEYPLRPMHGLTWAQSYAYSQWLNYHADSEGLFALPTEAQWCKSAQGPKGNKYPWGPQWQDNYANTVETDPDRTTDVNNYEKTNVSSYGCVDMVGNVWEWTLSMPNPLPYTDDGRNDASQSEKPRIIKGGSWKSTRGDTRLYLRPSDHGIPQNYRYEIGFRVVALKDPSDYCEIEEII